MGRAPGEGNGNPVFLPGKSHGQGSMAGYSPWGSQRVRHNLARLHIQPAPSRLLLLGCVKFGLVVATFNITQRGQLGQLWHPVPRALPVSSISILPMAWFLLWVSSGKTCRVYTQLDKGPETPGATREATRIPFLRQDEA